MSGSSNRVNLPKTVCEIKEATPNLIGSSFFAFDSSVKRRKISLQDVMEAIENFVCRSDKQSQCYAHSFQNCVDLVLLMLADLPEESLRPTILN